MQEKVMDSEKVKTCLFANELINVYGLFTKMLFNDESEMAMKLKRCLPKSLREYMHDINMLEF